MWNIGGSTTGDYGKKESDYKRQADYWTPQQKKTSQSLYQGVIAPGFKQYGDIYTGQPTDIEQMGLNQLRQFGTQSPELMTQGSGALSRALTGQGYGSIVDPAAAERMYQAIQDRTMKDILPKAVESASTQANVGGMLRSGTGQQLVTDEIGRVARALSEQLAGLKYQDELQRRDVAREREGRQLQGLGQMGQQYNQIAPLLQMGGMERDIAGTQFNNPMTQLALAYLGLRGQAEEKGSASQTGWNIGQTVRGGFGMQ
jgi:hypothetical protein